MKPWHEDEVFWEQWESFIFGKTQWESATADIENIISVLKIQPGSQVLDLCCGLGRHSLELARRGFHVVGVDRTKSYLDKAKKRATSENLEVDFILEDMRDFCRSNSFDVILNLYTSFSYFKDPEEDKQDVKYGQ
ncbi:MAG: class I SAM-dependent methyltransferase [Candidatus Heimdallarchaeota archaeon]